MTDELQGRLLVFCQFFLIVWLVATTNWQLFNGVALGFYCGSFSIVIRSLIVMPPGSFNITPLLKRDAPLVTSGPYRYIRHPMYVGVLLACGGLVATSFDVLRVCLLTFLFLVLYFKASMEERILLVNFSKYKALKAKTGMFIPGL